MTNFGDSVARLGYFWGGVGSDCIGRKNPPKPVSRVGEDRPSRHCIPLQSGAAPETSQPVANELQVLRVSLTVSRSAAMILNPKP